MDFFLSKKRWHPSSLATLEKVWKAEQAERKRMLELQEERQITRPRQERLDERAALQKS